jgi:hypothetical protein
MTTPSSFLCVPVFGVGGKVAHRVGQCPIRALKAIDDHFTVDAVSH